MSGTPWPSTRNPGTFAGPVVGSLAAHQARLPGEVSDPARALDPETHQIATVIDLAVGQGDQPLGGAGLGADQIGHHRLALHIDPRGAAADQVDPHHLRGGDPSKDFLQIVGLGCRPPAVDQHIARRAFEAADIVAAVEDEARQALDHVQGRGRAGVGEEIRRIAGHPLGAGRRDRIDRRLSQGGGGDEERAGCGQRSQAVSLIHLGVSWSADDPGLSLRPS